MKFPAFLLLFFSVLIATPLSAETIGQDAQACRTGQGPAIQVNILGLKDRKGEIWLELYPANDTDFLRDDTSLMAEHKTFRRTRGFIPAVGATSICVRVPHPGRYALVLRHNRVGKDKFSIWSDGAGVPTNKSLGMRKPTLDKATVDAGNGLTTLNIKMQYMNGFGFSPL
ncbi:MAG: DUF2141 domain-containing protein [Sphingomonas sp.]|uniref:DUF2141 domain-containing protein n=1 Tax=Sphingomonas sp. TaxID=28214 RepID=UPI001AC54E7F|nr:DUF2141 domain-containing protein [Sphingomonas sp.]MBN8808941.1 DUF2141 domain-containing protein [Sphingomonas sp.]